MRSITFAGLGAVALIGVLVMPAHAGTECYAAVSAKGDEPKASMRAAREEAMEAWEEAAEAKYDEDFDWYYSGDRTFSCKWKTGRDIVCTAKALPCERS